MANVWQLLLLPSSRLPEQTIISGHLSKERYLVVYTAVLKPVFSCTPDLSIKGSRGLSQPHSGTHGLSFLCVYVNFTKKCRRATSKRVAHHHLMSRDVPVKPSGQSLDGHVIITGQDVNIMRFLLSFYEISRWHPPHFPLLAKTRNSKTLLRKCLNINISVLSMVVKSISLWICSLWFAIEEFWAMVISAIIGILTITQFFTYNSAKWQLLILLL